MNAETLSTRTLPTLFVLNPPPLLRHRYSPFAYHVLRAHRFPHDRRRGGLGRLRQGWIPSCPARGHIQRWSICRRSKIRLGSFQHRLACQGPKVSRFRFGVPAWPLNTLDSGAAVLWFYERLNATSISVTCHVHCLCRTYAKLTLFIRQNRHVALKVVKSAPRYTETALDEIKLLQRLISGDVNHPGRRHVIGMGCD